MYTIWSEWDIDHEGKVFKTKEAAMKWLEENVHLQEVLDGWDGDDKPLNVRDIMENEGLVGVEKLNVVG